MFARQNQGRTAARGSAAMRGQHLAARLLLVFSVAAVAAGSAGLPQSALAAVATPAVTFTDLTLLNGWGAYSSDSASPAIADISGVVYFKGAISTSSSNTNNVAFILPPGFRPSKSNSNDACFTSLDGASFALSTTSFTKLKLQSGWTELTASSGKPPRPTHRRHRSSGRRDQDGWHESGRLHAARGVPAQQECQCHD